MACSYPECKTPDSDEFRSSNDIFCVFHAPIDQKGVDEVRFYELLKNFLLADNNNLKGFKFPWFISFETITHQFVNMIDFSESEFSGENSYGILYSPEGEQKQSSIVAFSASFFGIKFLQGVNFTRCKFENAVDFRSIKILSNAGLFNECTFKGEVFFEYAKFNNCHIEFLQNNETKRKTEFYKNVYFTNINYEAKDKQFKIQNADFLKDVIFTSSNIKAYLFSIDHSRFRGQFTYFNKMSIDSIIIHFTNAEFKAHLNSFKNSIFNGSQISYHGSTFFYLTSFVNTEFNKKEEISTYENSFRNVNFIGDEVQFINTKFNCGKVYFNEALFYSKTLFNETKFFQGASFYESKFTNLKYNRVNGKLIKDE